MANMLWGGSGDPPGLRGTRATQGHPSNQGIRDRQAVHTEFYQFTSISITRQYSDVTAIGRYDVMVQHFLPYLTVSTTSPTFNHSSVS